MKNKTVLGYQTLSEQNLRKLFGTGYDKRKPKKDDEITQGRKKIIQQTIKEQINIEESDDNFESIDWQDLGDRITIFDHGEKSISAYVKKVSDELATPLIEKLEKFYLESDRNGEFVPPENFIIQPGWVMYPYGGGEPVIGMSPQGEVYVLDTETFVRGFPTKHCPPDAKTYKEGIYGFAAPLIATASDESANYIWMHSHLTEDKLDLPWVVELVPLPERESIVLMFNSAYDISRIANVYSLEESQIKYMDLMSMVTARRGFSDDQKTLAKKLRKEGNFLPNWVREGIETSLKNSYNFYCGSLHPEIAVEDKKIRDFFVEMTNLRQLWGNLTQMLTYSQRDSTYTYRLAIACLPDYLGARGLNSSIYCHAELAEMRFRVNGSEWSAFLEDCEDKFHSNLAEQSQIFDRIADRLYEDYLDGYLTEEEIAADFWLSKLDWSSQGKIINRKVKYYQAIAENKETIDLPLIALTGSTKVKDLTVEWQQKYPAIHKLKKVSEEVITEKTEGYLVPKWYYPKYRDGSLNLTVKKREAHYLLRLKYLDSPLQYVLGEGWLNLKGEKPPHKNGVGLNVGFAISNHQYQYFEQGCWTSDGEGEFLDRLFKISEACSFWSSTRSRALNKLVYNDVMIAEMIPIQTVTQRSGSTLWSVVPNPQISKIGSDFKNLVKPAIGNKLLGFDFSSQEAAIFSILGSSYTGLENSNAYAHMTLTGSKDVDPPTDIHSTIARLKGTPRNIAKNLVYAVQFGGGVKRCTNVILSGDPSKPLAQAEEEATDLLTTFKGQKVNHSPDHQMFLNGFASDCFNVLMERGSAFTPKFPLTGQEYPLTLQTKNTGKEFILTRNNLQIQGTGKHLLELVIMLSQYWCKQLNIKCRLVLSIHDALIVEAEESGVKKVAAVLNMAHAYAWAVFREQLGICEIGLSGLFLESVEVGDFIMKDVKSKTATPFNPSGSLEGAESTRYVLTLKDILLTLDEIWQRQKVSAL